MRVFETKFNQRFQVIGGLHFFCAACNTGQYSVCNSHSLTHSLTQLLTHSRTQCNSTRKNARVSVQTYAWPVHKQIRISRMISFLLSLVLSASFIALCSGEWVCTSKCPSHFTVAAWVPTDFPWFSICITLYCLLGIFCRATNHLY